MGQSLYQEIGGAEVIGALVDHFYQIMDAYPEAAGIRRLHPPDLGGSRDKLFLFLVGWMGGPPIYVEKYGHPRLRARHLPFPIGEAERDQWLFCMNQAMEDLHLSDALRGQLREAFAQTADHMRNQTG